MKYDKPDKNEEKEHPKRDGDMTERVPVMRGPGRRGDYGGWDGKLWGDANGG